MRRIIVGFWGALTIALGAPVSRAQEALPSGNFGYCVVCEQGPPDTLTVVNANAAAPGAALPIVYSSPLAFGVSRSLNRRSFQAGMETAVALATDPATSAPVLFVPTTDPATGFGYAEMIDFRPGLSPPPTPIPILLDAGPTPYDILVDPGLPQVYASAIDSFGNLVVYVIDYATVNAPTLAAAIAFLEPPSPFVSRMLRDPSTGNIVIGSLTRLVGMTPAFTTVFNVQAPAGLVIGTNLAAGFAGANGQNVLCGLRAAGGAAGHGWLSVSPATGASTAGPVNAFGANPVTGTPWVLAAGYHEIAISSAGASGDAVATFLLDDVGTLGVGFGQVSLLVNLAAAPGNAVTSTVLPVAPFGNPEPMTGANGDPVTFLCGSAAVDFLVSVGTGATSPQGAVGLRPLAGLVTPAAVDRPFSLPGGNEVAVATVIGAAGAMEGFTVAGISMSPSFAFGFPGPATTLSNVLRGGLFGSQPVIGQGFAGAHALVIGAPLAGAPAAFVSAPSFGFPAIAGGLVLVPPAPGTVPNLGPRRVGFNAASGSTGAPLVIYGGNSAGTLGVMDVVIPGSAAPATYVSGTLGAMLTEILPY